jgi:hypothetical protein
MHHAPLVQESGELIEPVAVARCHLSFPGIAAQALERFAPEVNKFVRIVTN